MDSNIKIYYHPKYIRDHFSYLNIAAMCTDPHPDVLAGPFARERGHFKSIAMFLEDHLEPFLQFPIVDRSGMVPYQIAQRNFAPLGMEVNGLPLLKSDLVRYSSGQVDILKELQFPAQNGRALELNTYAISSLICNLLHLYQIVEGIAIKNEAGYFSYDEEFLIREYASIKSFAQAQSYFDIKYNACVASGEFHNLNRAAPITPKEVQSIYHELSQWAT